MKASPRKRGAVRGGGEDRKVGSGRKTLTAEALLDLPTGRFTLSKHPLPRYWMPLDKRILNAADIQISRGKLRLKVLVFATPATLRAFWKKKFGSDLGAGCPGVVTRMYLTYENPHTGKTYQEVDPRYYAVMGLCKSQLDTEILVHEGLHAAMAYVCRTRKRGRQWSGENAMGEEEIAYPLGRIVSELTNWLHGEGLL